jgi:hypothetical protein
MTQEEPTMNLFDCETRETTYASLERALGVSRGRMDAVFNAMTSLQEGARADEEELFGRLNCGVIPNLVDP